MGAGVSQHVVSHELLIILGLGRVSVHRAPSGHGLGRLSSSQDDDSPLQHKPYGDGPPRCLAAGCGRALLYSHHPRWESTKSPHGLLIQFSDSTQGIPAPPLASASHGLGHLSWIVTFRWLCLEEWFLPMHVPWSRRASQALFSRKGGSPVRYSTHHI